MARASEQALAAIGDAAEARQPGSFELAQDDIGALTGPAAQAGLCLEGTSGFAVETEAHPICWVHTDRVVAAVEEHYHKLWVLLLYLLSILYVVEIENHTEEPFESNMPEKVDPSYLFEVED